MWETTVRWNVFWKKVYQRIIIFLVRKCQSFSFLERPIQAGAAAFGQKTQYRTPAKSSSNDIDQSYKLSTRDSVFVQIDLMLSYSCLTRLMVPGKILIGKGMAPTWNQTHAAKPLDPVMAVFQHQLTASDKCLQTECRGGKVFTSYCESKPVSFFHSIWEKNAQKDSNNCNCLFLLVQYYFL